MESTLKSLFSYICFSILSILFVFSTGFDGEKIETPAELANAFPMKTGFPLHFAELRYPRIDPPLPWNYGGNCCSFFVTSWTNFWLSVILIFLFLVAIKRIIFHFIKKYAPNQ